MWLVGTGCAAFSTIRRKADSGRGFRDGWAVDKATAESMDLIRNYLVKPLTREMAAGLMAREESVSPTP